MCIFHEVLSIDASYDLSPVVVALSSLQKGSTLFQELSSVDMQGTDLNSPALRYLTQVSLNPYKYLATLLSFPAEQGKAQEAFNALTSELARADSTRQFYDAMPVSEKVSQITMTSDTRSLLKIVAEVGHSARPAFLEWFANNPSNEVSSRAIKALDQIAKEFCMGINLAETIIKPCCEKPKIVNIQL